MASSSLEMFSSKSVHQGIECKKEWYTDMTALCQDIQKDDWNKMLKQFREHIFGSLESFLQAICTSSDLTNSDITDTTDTTGPTVHAILA